MRVYRLIYSGGVSHPGPFAVIFSANGNERAREAAAEKCRAIGQRVGRISGISLSNGSLRDGGEEKLGRVLSKEEADQFFKTKHAVQFDPRHYV